MVNVVANTKTAPPIVGVFCLFAWFGTYLFIGCCAFFEIAQAINFGRIRAVRIKAMKKPIPVERKCIAINLFQRTYKEHKT